MAMKKKELAARLAETTGLSKSDAIRAVEGIMDVMSEAFAKKDSVFLRGFGTLKVVHRAEKKARNIRLNCEVIIPAHLSVKFIPSPVLDKKMNRWR